MKKKLKNNKNNKKYPTPKKAQKIDKNKVYAFILLGLMLFWSIGSIFGIVAYKNKRNNTAFEVVGASADEPTNTEQRISVVSLDFLKGLQGEHITMTPLENDFDYEYDVIDSKKFIMVNPFIVQFDMSRCVFDFLGNDLDPFNGFSFGLDSSYDVPELRTVHTELKALDYSGSLGLIYDQGYYFRDVFLGDYLGDPVTQDMYVYYYGVISGCITLQDSIDYFPISYTADLYGQVWDVRFTLSNSLGDLAVLRFELKMFDVWNAPLTSNVNLGSFYCPALGSAFDLKSYAFTPSGHYSYNLPARNSSISYAAGFSDGKEVGYGEGYAAGSEKGRAEGFVDGFNSINQTDAYNQGKNEGFFDGRELGYSEGKQAGFNEGVASANDYTFYGLMTSAVDVPLQTFYGLFNFNILGINLSTFFLSLLTLCILLTVVKLLI